MSAGLLNIVFPLKTDVATPVILDVMGKAMPGQETQERLDRIARGLGRLSRCHFSFPAVSDEQLDAALSNVHTDEYLNFLSSCSDNLKLGELLINHSYVAPDVEPDTPIVSGIYDVAREGIRAAIAAAAQTAGGAQFTYALCRPPGHHAGPDWLGGYCYLNNATAATITLLTMMSKVALIDFDYHFGNGSASILESRSNVLYGSVHCSTEEAYPYTKTESANNRQVFIAFEQPPTQDEFLNAVRRLVEQSLSFGCVAMVVSVGYDIIAGDRHGTWSLPPDIFEEVGSILLRANIPLCLIQEGGYLLDRLEECSYRLGRGLLGGD